ncbi:MAG: hypothetical protein BWY32_02336 [bacterium ADurb.Bin243]|nr:MAG: hypothetical protein BWY32_02336 [bacterium ADurb.Bin243]
MERSLAAGRIFLRFNFIDKRAAYLRRFRSLEFFANASRQFVRRLEIAIFVTADSGEQYGRPCRRRLFPAVFSRYLAQPFFIYLKSPAAGYLIKIVEAPDIAFNKSFYITPAVMKFHQVADDLRGGELEFARLYNPYLISHEFFSRGENERIRQNLEPTG